MKTREVQGIDAVGGIHKFVEWAFHVYESVHQMQILFGDPFFLLLPTVLVEALVPHWAN